MADRIFAYIGLGIVVICIILMWLWPLIRLYIENLKYRKKIRAMENFIVELLKQMGCQPEVDKEDGIRFKYQGENFLIQILTERLIRIGDYWWLELKLDNPMLEYLKEAINLTNQSSQVTVMYSINQDESLLGVHCVCQTGFYKEVPDIGVYLTYLLDSCFKAQREVKVRLSSLINREQTDRTSHERIKVKGFK